MISCKNIAPASTAGKPVRLQRRYRKITKEGTKMKKRNIDLLREERKKNEALQTNVKVLVRECELLKSRMDTSAGNGAARYQASLSLMKQRENNLNRAKDVLDAMAMYLASKYGDNGELRIPRPDMDLLKSNAINTVMDHDSIIVRVMRTGNANGHD